MSFLLLMELHSESVQRLNMQGGDDAEEVPRMDDGTYGNHHAGTCYTRSGRRWKGKRTPFIVVTSKIDLLNDRTMAVRASRGVDRSWDCAMEITTGRISSTNTRRINDLYPSRRRAGPPLQRCATKSRTGRDATVTGVIRVNHVKGVLRVESS